MSKKPDEQWICTWDKVEGDSSNRVELQNQTCTHQQYLTKEGNSQSKNHAKGQMVSTDEVKHANTRESYKKEDDRQKHIEVDSRSLGQILGMRNLSSPFGLKIKSELDGIATWAWTNIHKNQVNIWQCRS